METNPRLRLHYTITNTRDNSKVIFVYTRYSQGFEGQSLFTLTHLLFNYCSYSSSTLAHDREGHRSS